MIVCIGDIMIDIFLLSHLQEAEQGSGIVMRGGGSAANTAAWLARSRVEATFGGCVGKDAAGIALVQELTAAGVTSRVRAIPGADTGAVLIRVEEDGTERVMRSSRGANTALAPSDIERAASGELACIHLTGYALLGPHGLDLLDAASRIAQTRGVILSFDPSSPGVIKRFGPSTLLDAMRRCGVDVLLPNVEEAVALTGDEPAMAAVDALAAYVPTVLMKAGAAGSNFASAESSGAVRATPARVLDPTGAGDAFNAGALAALVAGKPAAEACQNGVALASMVLGAYGGRPLSGTPHPD